MSLSNCREIKLIFQLTKSVVIDTSYSMGDIKKMIIEIFNPLLTDDITMTIRDFDVTNLEKINVFHSLDYYKSNNIIVNSHPSILNKKKLLNLNDKYVSLNGDSEMERLKKIIDQLREFKESYSGINKLESSGHKAKYTSSKEKQLTNSQWDLRKSNGMASKNEFPIHDDKIGSKKNENKANETSRNQNFFSPSHQNINYMNSIDNKDLHNQPYSASRHNNSNKSALVYFRDKEKELFNESDSFSNILDIIHNEIKKIMEMNVENIEKKEKLKKNLVKSQDTIKILKEQLENSLCKERVYEKMVKDSQRIQSSDATENENDIINSEYKQKINELENYIVSLNRLNNDLQKNIEDYEDYTNELKKTIDILKSKGNVLETENNQCMCDVKNQEILTLKKVIDELCKKCEDYEKQKKKESIISLDRNDIDKQGICLNLENVLKIGIEEKDKLIESLKTTEANMNIILARYKEDLVTLCKYLKENKSNIQNKPYSYLSNKGNQNDIFYILLKKKEEIISELNIKINNQSQIMKELVKLNNQLSNDLKNICSEEAESNNPEDYKYQINLLKKINDILLNKNTELSIQYGNQISCQPQNNKEITPYEKIKDLEIKLANITDDYDILKKQNEIYKQLFDNKNFITFSSNEGFEILGKLRLKEYLRNQEISIDFISDVVPREVVKEELTKLVEEEVNKNKILQKQIENISSQLKEAIENSLILRENIQTRDKELSKKILENEDFKSNLLSSQKEVNKFADEANRLKDEVKRINENRDNLNIEINNHKKHINNYSIQIQELEGKITKQNLKISEYMESLKKTGEDALFKQTNLNIILDEKRKIEEKMTNLEQNSKETIKKLNVDNLSIQSQFNDYKVKKEQEIEELKKIYEEKSISQNQDFNDTINKLNNERQMIQKEYNDLKLVKEEEIKDVIKNFEEKILGIEQNFNNIIKQLNEEKQTIQNELNEIKSFKDLEIKEVQKKMENEILELKQKNYDDKSLLESQLKHQSEFLQRYKFESENLKVTVDKLTQEKEKILNESFNKTKDSKSADNMEKEMKNYEIQINSLINDNKDLSRKLEEMKTKYSSIKDDYERMLKNSLKNDLLNRYNILDKKYITLKKEYRNLYGNHSKLEKSSLIHNLSHTGNNFLTSSEEEEEDITDDDHLFRKLVTIKEGTTFIFSVFDNKRILRFDLENRKFYLQDFADFADFENNFDPQGSIYLNIKDGLLIVTGENHDLFYQYTYSKNCINKLNKLNDNHSHGGLIYYEKENSLICLSGWHNRRVEKYLNVDINFTFMNEMDLSNKKINEKNKNIWVNMPEMISERSECPYLIVNNLYLYVFFGFNCPKMKYLDTIERINLDKQDFWENVKFNNELHLSTFIKSHSCIKYTEDEILFVGGYDGKNEIPVENFSFYNFKTNKITPNNRKFPDIMKNHCYYFQKHFNFIPFIESDNKKHFASIDEHDNIHVIEVSSLQYDIYKFDD